MLVWEKFSDCWEIWPELGWNLNLGKLGRVGKLGSWEVGIEEDCWENWKPFEVLIRGSLSL